ncbi:DUF2142 domain-containing protein [Streptococcus orisratti]|uniref:DUF2142 domain-containing protein n=1 Tax=Streptococcus orisratti TaxID=114652 RepID=UPI0023F6E40E|nr:DUF2142 domain-containing protein [Streptococcus orisratti]
MTKTTGFSLFGIVKSNYKYVLSILATIIMAVVLYTDAMDLPMKFLGLLFLVSVLLIICLPRKIEYATVAIILLMGGISALISPINDIPDERVHYARAVYISEGDINLSNKKANLKISEDVKRIDEHAGQTIISETLKGTKHSTKEFIYPEVKMTNAYYSLSYLPQVIGISLGNLLHLPLVATYYLGRICNLLVYALLIFFAIKLAGRLKQVVAVTSLIPMNIYLAASYNQDGFALGLVILALAVFMNMLQAEDNKISGLKLLSYYLLCGLLVLSKFTYFLLVILPFFIPSTKFDNNKKLVFVNKILGILIVTGFAAIWFKLYGQVKIPILADFLKQVNVGEQIHNLIHSPLVYGRVVFREMLVNVFNLDNILRFGGLTYGTTNLFTLYAIFTVFVYLNNATKVKLHWWTHLGVFLVIAGITGATVLAMFLTWTPVGSMVVLGVQSRYLIGILPLLFLLFTSKNQQLEKISDFLSTKTLLNVALLFDICMLLSTIFRYYN